MMNFPSGPRHASGSCLLSRVRSRGGATATGGVRILPISNDVGMVWTMFWKVFGPGFLRFLRSRNLRFPCHRIAAQGSRRSKSARKMKSGIADLDCTAMVGTLIVFMFFKALMERCVLGMQRLFADVLVYCLFDAFPLFFSRRVLLHTFAIERKM